MKRFILASLLLVIILLPIDVEATNKDLTIYVNDKIVTSDVKPFIENGRTMLPIRFVAENLDFIVEYENNPLYGDTVYLKSNDDRNNLMLSMGVIFKNDFIYFSDNSTNDYPYMKKNDRIFVSARHLANALNMDIKWNQKTWSVYLYSSNEDKTYPLYLTNQNNEIYKSDFIINFKNNDYYFNNTNVKFLDYVNKNQDKLNSNLSFSIPINNDKIIGGFGG